MFMGFVKACKPATSLCAKLLIYLPVNSVKVSVTDVVLVFSVLVLPLQARGGGI